MAILGPTGVPWRVNPAFENALGYTAAELCSRPMIELVHPDDAGRAETALSRVRAADQTTEFRQRLRGSDGRYRTISWRCSAPDADGMVYAAGNDVTDAGATGAPMQHDCAEAKLLEGDGGYRVLFEGSPLPMWVWDAETFEFLAVNDAAIEHYGYSRAEFLTMSLADLRPPEDIAAMHAAATRPTHGRVVAGVWRHRKKNGELIDVEIARQGLSFGGRNAQLTLLNDVTGRNTERARLAAHAALDGPVAASIREPEGTTSNGASFAIDFTDWRKAERDRSMLMSALEFERSRLNSIFVKAPAFIAVLRGPDHVFDLVNEASQRLVDFQDPIGRPMRDVFPDLRDQGFVEVLDRVLATGVPFVGNEVPVTLRRHAAGVPEQCFVNFVYQPLIDADGQRSGIFVHGVDVSMQVRAANDARESEAQLAEAQRLAGIGSWQLDLVSGAMIWSAEAYRQLGYEPGRVEPTLEGFAARLHPDDRDRVLATIARTGATGGSVVFDARYLQPDGTVLALQSGVQVVVDGDGTPVRMTGTAQDVTRQKDIETAMITARAAAEAANATKSEFLASMSHELRTPLNSVIGFANILLKNKAKTFTAKEIGYLHRIAANGRHLLGLIDSILDLSKIEAGRMELSITSVPVDALIRETIAELEPQAEARAVHIIAELPLALAPLRTDRQKLRQVIVNLLGNAVKFTERGTVTVRVTRHRDTDRPGRIDFIDTGIGIAAERLGAVFEAFRQADNTTARNFGGTGLGLTITRSLAELMGFEVSVTSEVGVGSTFSLGLEKNEDRETGGSPREAAPDPPATTATAWRAGVAPASETIGPRRRRR